MQRICLSKSGVLAALAILLAMTGCVSSQPFAPAHYVVDPNRPYRVATARTITVCPVFNHLPDAGQPQPDAPVFDVSAYLTGVIEDELTAAGVSHDRVSFARSPDFAGLQGALHQGVLKRSDDVVLAGAVNFLGGNRVLSCDFKVYSTHGDLLFQKRCLCMNYTRDNPKELEMGEGANFITGPGSADPAYAADNHLMAPRMVMQQLFADPDFQKAIQ